ncbi:uncharacterized protein LOC109715361 [Ananas comosus]|uniref:Uncharacterized protein LOC109715361 n=1 Tax=Ananas comosus TaxID=4615 RepID=A0A6P5FR07_ANACO|nr:uncharacterized protein LOC109715361 [Ananas comosus]
MRPVGLLPVRYCIWAASWVFLVQIAALGQTGAGSSLLRIIRNPAGNARIPLPSSASISSARQEDTLATSEPPRASRGFARFLRASRATPAYSASAGASPEASILASAGSQHQASLPSTLLLPPLFSLQTTGLGDWQRDCRMARAPEVQNRAGRPMMPSVQARGPPPPARPRVEPVDREKTCPLLLRVFTKVGMKTSSISHWSLKFTCY